MTRLRLGAPARRRRAPRVVFALGLMETVDMSDYPWIFRARQRFDNPRVDDVAAETEAQLAKLRLGQRVRPGESVAVPVGSRGIADIAVITRALVRHLQALGAKPFLVPAMGSHGGGKAEEQRAIIEGYGVTEEYCGCPIRASMETVVVCQAAEGFPVHFDKHAAGADHVMVMGRVKPHTNFVGEIESGLMKMLLIGLGKHEGAKIYHRAILDYSFGQIVRGVAREVLAKCKILAGLAIVENARDETALLAAMLPDEIESREKELLRLAKQWLPRLPFPIIDLLLVDEIGKDISGAGMDTNVIGRKHNDHVAAPDEYPKIRRIAVRGLTPATKGNATGIGMAEFCLGRVTRAIDVPKTRVNCLTGGHPTAAMLPLDYRTDREIFDAALPTIGLTEPADARVLWIKNTLDVAELECSRALWNAARELPHLDILTEPRPLPFDAAGNLPNLRDYKVG